MRRVGLLLAGCGAHDGSDIHETVLAALALERALAHVVYLAPAGPQEDVVDHASGTRDDAAPPRDRLVESARLARGRLLELSPAAVSDLAALVVPGGVGVLKNLFADLLVPGRSARLRDEPARAIAALRSRGGALAAIGTAHALFAAAGEPFVDDPFAVPPGAARVDAARRLAYAPGFLGARTLDEAARGIDELARAVAGFPLRPARP